MAARAALVGPKITTLFGPVFVSTKLARADLSGRYNFVGSEWDKLAGADWTEPRLTAFVGLYWTNGASPIFL